MYSILIIDDEPIVKIALRSILPWEEHGFSICGTASNGLEAMSLIEKHQPDVIITDLKMPEMDGLELIRTLKEKNYPGEILVLSNYEDFDSVRSALLLGAADYLLKIKISPDTLLACLNKTTEKLQEKPTGKFLFQPKLYPRTEPAYSSPFLRERLPFPPLQVKTPAQTCSLCRNHAPSAM